MSNKYFDTDSFWTRNKQTGGVCYFVKSANIDLKVSDRDYTDVYPELMSKEDVIEGKQKLNSLYGRILNKEK